jgi:hypothetical protein
MDPSFVPFDESLDFAFELVGSLLDAAVLFG